MPDTSQAEILPPPTLKEFINDVVRAPGQAVEQKVRALETNFHQILAETQQPIVGESTFADLAKRSQTTGTEFYAPLHESNGRLKAGTPREGWKSQSPIVSHPENEGRVGTIHTHPNPFPFSPQDVLSFTVSPDAVMATATPDNRRYAMVKTRPIEPQEALATAAEAALQYVRFNLHAALKPQNVEQRAARVVSWNLDTCRKLGINFIRSDI